MNIDIKKIERQNFKDWTECYTYMAEMLTNEGYVKKGYCESLLNREKMFPTGLIMGNNFCIAVPHASDPSLALKTTLLVAFPDPRLSVNLMEDFYRTTDADLIVMLCLRKTDSHTDMLQSLMKIFQDAEFTRELKRTKDHTLISEKLQLVGSL